MNKKLIDWWIGGASYSAAAQSVFTNIGGTLSASVKNAIATFVDAEVAAGRWTNHLDVFQLYGTALGSESQGLKNWISSSYTATNPNGHTATVNGYDLPGTASATSFILTNYNPTTGAKYTSTDATQMIYINRNDSSVDYKVLLGYSGNDGWYQRTVASRLDFHQSVNNNLPTSQIAGYANGFTQGLYQGIVEDAGGGNYRIRFYQNGSSIVLSGTGIPTELNQSLIVGGRGVAGGGAFDGIVSCYAAGAGTGFSASGFYTNFNTLITALGVKI